MDKIPYLSLSKALFFCQFDMILQWFLGKNPIKKH
nr:MAG TPA: hypothetical protein [Caudoviricetes sp.]